MKRTYFTALLVFILVVFAPSAQAQVKLGIEIKQGYDSAYVADIDPNGLAAAAGIMKGDYIKEIDNVALWFTHQLRGTMGIKKADKPFTVVVRRGETLHSIRVDPAKPAKSWRRIKGGDALSDCYLSPTADCIIDLSMKNIKTETDADKRFSARVATIGRLVQIDRLDLAKAEFEKLKVEYYQLPKLEYNFSATLRLFNVFGEKPSEKLLSHALNKVKMKGGKLNIGSLLRAAEYLGEYGYKNEGVPFVMPVVEAAKKSPKLIKYDSRGMGRALGATEQYDLMKSYLKLEDFDSRWGSQMLEAAFLYHMKQEDLKSAEKVMKIILTFPRSKTNKDDLIFIRMFRKAQQDKLVYKFINRLKDQTEKMDPLFKPLLARSLVKAYGAVGNIHMGRKTIEQYFKTNRLGPMLDLTIESANSRSTPGLAVQFYRDLPKLIAETHTLVKNASAKDKKSNKLDIKKFYLVLAAHLQSNFTLQEYDAYGFDDYEYENMIEAFTEVRRYDEALAWTVAKERKFGKTWSYYDVFSMYGASASPDKIDKLKRHPKFSEHGKFFDRAYLKRLYWGGHVEDAANLFKSLSLKEKEIAIFGQMPFVSVCKKCDL